VVTTYRSLKDVPEPLEPACQTREIAVLRVSHQYQQRRKTWQVRQLINQREFRTLSIAFDEVRDSAFGEFH
jgi:hypothetical protein